MDAWLEGSEHTPCDPQPPGKIRKALKLFSKRKAGGAVAGIFSIHKGERGPKSPSRSKTLDGLNETAVLDTESLDLNMEDSQKEEAASEDQIKRESNLESTSVRQSISSITSAKSLSFLTMLRRSRKGGGAERQAQTESLKSGHQRKGLKGLFGSIQWYRKDKAGGDEVTPGPPLLASRSNSVEIMKECPTARNEHDTEPEFHSEQHFSPALSDPAFSTGTTKVSTYTEPPTPSSPSTMLGDISSILNLDSVGAENIVDVEWVKVSCEMEREGTSRAGCIQEDRASASATSTPSPSQTSKALDRNISSAAFLSPSSSCKPGPSVTASSHHSLPTKATSSLGSAPISLPTSSARPIAPPVTFLPQSPTLITKPLPPASPPTPEPSPEPSPTTSLVTTPTVIFERNISVTDLSPTEHAVSPVTMENVLSTVLKHTSTLAPSLTKAPYPAALDLKCSAAPAPKYPPFITSTKPPPTAPVSRPKIVTTFGLSTSRNTAPIIKPEPKHPALQPKLSFTQSENERGWSVLPPQAPAAESKHAHTSKHMSEVTAAQIPATSARPSFKSELQSYSSAGPPTLSSAPPPFTASKEEKNQENLSNLQGVKESPSEARSLPHLPISSNRPEKKILIVKPTAFSKIPVSAAVRPKSSKSSESNGNDGHSNLLIQDPEPASPSTPLPGSCSKDSLTDICAEPGMVLPAQFHSHENIVEAVSLHKESRIPVKPGSTAVYHSVQAKSEVARSKIPISKLPIRRSGNTSALTLSAAVKKQ